MFMASCLGHYIRHLTNKTGSSIAFHNVPFNLSGYCCFEYRDSLKVTLLKKSLCFFYVITLMFQ